MSRGGALVDGRPVEVRDGETILAAASRAGIEIPTLCHVEGCRPDGGCRLCVVHTNRGERPEAACHTPIEPGMEVVTTSPELEAWRRGLLELIVDAHGGGDAATSTNGSGPNGNELAALLRRFGAEPPHRAASDTSAAAVDASHPYLRFDAGSCIVCRRCVHVCEEVQGQFVYGIAGRGGDARLVLGPSGSFAESGCTACGACVDACPTDALGDRDRAAGTPPATVTTSTCGYCGVGCRVAIESDGERVLRISPAPGAAVNRGHLCSKGRYAHAYQHAEDRLTRPLLRAGDGWREIGWDVALRVAAERLDAIRDEHGPDALGVFTSSRSTNEAAYLFQKLFRTHLGTNNVDCCARVCHSSTALALRQVTGTGAASASYTDIERARCIFVAGANPTEAHPVVGARIQQAVLAGARLVVADPRRIELAEYADVHLGLRPGTNVALFNALAKLLLEEDAADRAYLEQRTEGLRELESFLCDADLASCAEACDVDPETMRAAARILGSAGPTLFVHGLGLSELTQGTESVMALCNLGMLTGSIGRPGAGMLPLRGQNNVQGNADMGAMPNLVTGYRPVDDEGVRAHAASVWGAPPPPAPGLTIPEMLDAAARGEIRALWIQGEDVAQSDPNETHVVAALGALDFLVVQELFLSRTARHAHLVLPAAGALEQEGTFTNGERRIQHVRPAVAPPGEARPDWEVARDLARTMGLDWSYGEPSEVMDEVARVAPHLFGGVSYDRLEPDGIQWPCPDPGHPGTASVHADGFLRGKGRLTTIEYRPSPEHDVEGFPYLLNTGRVLQHYNVGTMTRRTPQRDLVPADLLEIHPDDASREGIADGDAVELESRWGSARPRARLSERVDRGELFLSFHYPDTHANRLTGPHVDPLSKCPQYKATAVRIRR